MTTVDTPPSDVFSMAVVAASFPRHRFDLSDASRLDMDMDNTMGTVHLVPNPDFVFPMRPSQQDGVGPPGNRRPVSMHLTLSPAQLRSRPQRQSVSTLPTFTFNSTNTTGLLNHGAEPSPAGSADPVTPSRNMKHRRGASEFVGGDSRFGVSTLVSTSPIKTGDTLPLPDDRPSTTGSPARRRGHAHRRSTAISGHDLSAILQPRDSNLAPSSVSTTTADHQQPQAAVFSPQTQSNDSVPPTESCSDTFARPPSRPRVGFSENVEYIPRPLSTVSSDTVSSASTLRGHSVANSISSVISLGGIGTPSQRRNRTPPIIIDSPSGLSHGYPFPRDTTRLPEDMPRSLAEGDRNKASSESTATSPNLSITFEEPEASRLSNKKRAFLKLDRRRSEPLISTSVLQQPGLSTISLHEPVTSNPMHEKDTENDDAWLSLSRKSSRRKVKQWANAFLGRRTVDPRKTKSLILSSTEPLPSPGLEATPSEQDPFVDADLDLDAVFGQDSLASLDNADGPSFPTLGLTTDTGPTFSRSDNDNDDPSPIIDLDAALGPYGTPSMSGSRRQMHSGNFGRRCLDRNHNRTYSLPTLAPFDHDRTGSPKASPMADVFEEEEEADSHSTSGKPACPLLSVPTTETDEETGTGIQIVDAATEDETMTRGRISAQGLGIDRQTDTTAEDGALAVPGLQPSMLVQIRRTSIVEDTIFEESSPVEIVEDFEEPRTSSVTKSSDSSEASTVLPDPGNLAMPLTPSAPSPSTPVSYIASTFSSPDGHGYHGLFDPGRLGTSTSSMTDNRTISSLATAEHGLDMRISVEDVPSLTSSHSTMMSAAHFNSSRRDFSDRSGSVASMPAEAEVLERRRKRSSIHSLSRLVGGPFGESRNRLPFDQRPQTAMPTTTTTTTTTMFDDGKKKKEHRMSKLLFWRSKGDVRSVSSSK